MLQIKSRCLKPTNQIAFKTYRNFCDNFTPILLANKIIPTISLFNYSDHFDYPKSFQNFIKKSKLISTILTIQKSRNCFISTSCIVHPADNQDAKWRLEALFKPDLEASPCFD